MKSNIDIVTAFYTEIWSRQDLALIDKLIHPDYHPEDIQIDADGAELVRKEVKYFNSIFSDLRYEITDFNEKSESVIWVSYRVTGRFTGRGWGFEPTGKVTSGTGVGIFTIKEGMITNQERYYSLYDLFVEAGAVPPFWELAGSLDQWKPAIPK